RRKVPWPAARPFVTAGQLPYRAVMPLSCAHGFPARPERAMARKASGETGRLGPVILVDRLKANRGAVLAAVAALAAMGFFGGIPLILIALAIGFVVLAALVVPPPPPPPPPLGWELEAEKDPLAAALLEALLEPGILLTARGTIYA